MSIISCQAMQEYIALKNNISNSTVFNTVVHLPEPDILKSRLLGNNLSHLIKTNVHHTIGNKTYTVAQLLDMITCSFLHCNAYMDDPSSAKLLFIDQCDTMKIALQDHPEICKQLKTYALFKNI
jgi:hypothetical protein